MSKQTILDERTDYEDTKTADDDQSYSYFINIIALLGPWLLHSLLDLIS